MVKVTVDFSEVEEFSAVPKGEYPMVFEELVYVEPESEDKYPYINVKASITEGEYDGRNVWGIWSFSPKALWRMKQAFENLELPLDEVEFEVDEETDFVTEPALVGVPFVGVVVTETYEGRERSRLEGFLPSDSPKKGTKRGATSTAKAGAAKKPAGRKFK
jgi:hypothetical protein